MDPVLFILVLLFILIILLGSRRWFTLSERLALILIMIGTILFGLGMAAHNPPLKDQISPLPGAALFGCGILLAIHATFQKRR